MPHKTLEARRAYLQKRRESGAAQAWRTEWEARTNWRERRKSLPSYGRTTAESTLEARRAYWEVQKALKAGTLVRPSVCSRCGSSRFCEAAHSDYSKPLAVEWLCRSCHRSEDAAIPKKGKESRADSLVRIAANRRPPKFCPVCGKMISRPDRRTYCSFEHYVADLRGTGPG